MSFRMYREISRPTASIGILSLECYTQSDYLICSKYSNEWILNGVSAQAQAQAQAPNAILK